jgi:hypothetical protein
MPATRAAQNRLLFFFFLLRPFTVLMKKTRIIKQSIFLDVYGPNIQKIMSVSVVNVVKIRLEHSNLPTNFRLG